MMSVYFGAEAIGGIIRFVVAGKMNASRPGYLSATVLQRE